MTVNRLKEILEEKSKVMRLNRIEPSEEVLQKMNVTIRMWNKWVEKKSDPEIWQLMVIADFLDCHPSELFPNQPEPAL